MKKKIAFQIDQLSDNELAELIERPKSEIGAIPASTFRQISWTAKAGGNVFEAYLLATQG